MQGNRLALGVGALLVVIGILFLLQNFGVVGPLQQVLWAVLFGAGGLAFLWVFLTNREHWWAVIPGFTLLGLAGTIILSDIIGGWAGSFFLAAIGLSFWVIYAQRREFWWAVIPGGVLVTLAVVAGLSEVVPDESGEALGGVLFLGLAATFGLLYLLPTTEGQMKWALIPAGVLGIMGLVLIATAGELLGVVGPAVLILVGGYLVARTFLVRRA